MGQWDKGTLGQMGFALSGVSVVSRQMVLYELLYILLIYILIIYIIILIGSFVLSEKSKTQMSLCPNVPLSHHLTLSNCRDSAELKQARILLSLLRHFNI